MTCRRTDERTDGQKYHLIAKTRQTSRAELRHKMRSGNLPAYFSFEWFGFMFLMLFCPNSANFSEIQLVCDRPTDGQMDGRGRRRDGRINGRTDRQTDGPIDQRTDTRS